MIGPEIMTRRIPGLIWFRLSVAPRHWRLRRDVTVRVVERLWVGPLIFTWLRERKPGQRKAYLNADRLRRTRRAK